MGLLVNCSQLHELGVKLGPGCPSTLVLAASVPQYTHPPDVQQGFMAASSRAETVKLELSAVHGYTVDLKGEEVTRTAGS